MTPKQDVKEKWHLKKEIPITVILTILLSVGAGTLAIWNIRGDVDLHWQVTGQQISSLDTHIQNDVTSNTETRNLALMLLEKLDTKLDTIRQDINEIKIEQAYMRGKK